MNVYELGDEGGAWIVSGTQDVNRARVEVIKWLDEIYLPRQANGDADIFSEEVWEAVNAKATTYQFVAGDNFTERVYHDAAPHITPQTAYENGASWFGHSVVIGMTLPEWPKDDVTSSRGVYFSVMIQGEDHTETSYFKLPVDGFFGLLARYNGTIYQGDSDRPLRRIIYISVLDEKPKDEEVYDYNEMIDVEWQLNLREIGSM